MTKLPITVIILTLNEEDNLSNAIESAKHWTRQIFVVDVTFYSLEVFRRLKEIGVKAFPNCIPKLFKTNMLHGRST